MTDNDKVLITRLKVMHTGGSLDDAELKKRIDRKFAQVRLDLKVSHLLASELVHVFVSEPSGLYLDFYLQPAQQGSLLYSKKEAHKMFLKDLEVIREAQRQLVETYDEARYGAGNPTTDPELAERRSHMAEARKDGVLEIPTLENGEDFELGNPPRVLDHAVVCHLRFVVEAIYRTHCIVILREITTAGAPAALNRRVGKTLRLNREGAMRSMEAGNLLLTSLEKSVALQARAQVEFRWEDAEVKNTNITHDLKLADF